jgi:hypothetical protein
MVGFLNTEAKPDDNKGIFKTILKAHKKDQVKSTTNLTQGGNIVLIGTC